MTQQAQVVGDVTGHATMVEGYAAGRAALCVQLAMRLYGDVNVGFAYDGDIHFLFNKVDKSRKLLREFGFLVLFLLFRGIKSMRYGTNQET
jgi:hypothetical protein